jgi:hypothetical protein
MVLLLLFIFFIYRSSLVCAVANGHISRQPTLAVPGDLVGCCLGILFPLFGGRFQGTGWLDYF